VKIIKTHHDDYLGIFSSQKSHNSFFAVNVFVLWSETSQCGSYATLEKCDS